MSNPATLAPRWKPGESGNPGGRPKGYSPTAALRALLAKATWSDPEPKTKAQLLALHIFDHAMGRRKATPQTMVAAWKHILERVDGLPRPVTDDELETAAKAVAVELQDRRIAKADLDKS